MTFAAPQMGAERMAIALITMRKQAKFAGFSAIAAIPESDF
jgi:hypothetical protein